MAFDQKLFEKTKKKLEKQFAESKKKNNGSLFEKDQPKKKVKTPKYKTKMPKMGFY